MHPTPPPHCQPPPDPKTTPEKKGLFPPPAHTCTLPTHTHKNTSLEKSHTHQLLLCWLLLWTIDWQTCCCCCIYTLLRHLHTIPPASLLYPPSVFLFAVHRSIVFFLLSVSSSPPLPKRSGSPTRQRWNLKKRRGWIKTNRLSVHMLGGRLHSSIFKEPSVIVFIQISCINRKLRELLLSPLPFFFSFFLPFFSSLLVISTSFSILLLFLHW